MANQESELEKFIQALSRYNDSNSSPDTGPAHYPFNVLYNTDRKKLVEAYFNHHKKVRFGILLQLNLLSQLPAAIHDAETLEQYRKQQTRAGRLNVPIYDYDDFAGDLEFQGYAISFPRLNDMLGRLHWPIPVSLERTAERLAHGPPKVANQPSSLSNGNGSSPSHWAGVHLPNAYMKDPKCRFVLLETASADEHRLDISEDVLFLILSYHQVSPAYLNFITCFSSQTGSSDVRFGGFKCQSAFTHTDRAIAELGRSGLHFQVSFKLRTVLEKLADAKDGPGKVTGWSKPQAAIYHHFDVEEAKAFWVLTAPRRSFGGSSERNALWAQIRASIKANENADKTPRIKSDLHRDRFAASLDVLLSIGEWSLSDFAFYLQHIEEKLDDLTDRYLEDDYLPEVNEQILQSVNHWIQELNHCGIKLDGNVGVMKNLVDLYCGLAEKTKHLPQCRWLDDCVPDIETFKSQMNQMVGEITEIRARASALTQLATNREDFIQKLLQNRQTTYVSFLTELSTDESTLVRVFQTITLVLLPITVVSTLFSTDIVKFHNVDNSLRFSFSWMALVWFLGFMSIFGLIVFFWFRWLESNARFALEQRRLEAMKGGWGPRRLSEENGDDRGSLSNGMMTGAIPTEGVPVGRFNTREKRSLRKSNEGGAVELRHFPSSTIPC